MAAGSAHAEGESVTVVRTYVRSAENLVRLGLVAFVGLGFCLAGCTTTGNPSLSKSDVYQFEPVQVGDVDQQELAPIQPRSAEELIAEADAALKSANKAQEAGDHEAALRHYVMMLELLIEADVDPAAFYEKREELDKLLGAASEKVKLARLKPAPDWTPTLPDKVKVQVEVDLPIPSPLPARVEKEVQEILRVYPERFLAGMNRSGQYRPYIEAEFEKAGLPKDLIWLAMVESQFHPSVKSWAGAAGMWQFMPLTGKRFGLRIDDYVDERYDWRKSTQAAIEYLTDLHDMFDGNWPLAVTAYNKGERGLERAIAAGGGERNLWRLLETRGADRHLRLETKKFYPKLCASVLVARNPEKYGFKPAPMPEERARYVRVKGSYSLSDLEKEAGIASGTLKKLNPHLRRGVTPPYGDCHVAVPTDYNDRFVVALNKVPKLRPGIHVVRKGETISHIAARYGVSRTSLMNVNKIRSPRRLQIGQRLIVPGVMVQPTTTAAAPSYAVSEGGRRVYTVRPGDCLYDIAKQERVSVAQIKEWNKLRRSQIRVGEKLYVSAPGASVVASASGGTGQHVVRKGEYLGGIAQKHGMRLSTLLKLNNLSSKSTIRPGQKLTVYASAAPAASSSSSSSSGAQTTATHTVRKGESTSVIAEKYGMGLSTLLRMNNLSKTSTIRVGQELKVHASAAPAASASSSSSSSTSASATHTVRKGESASVIASKYDMSLSDFYRLNSITSKSVLRVGQQLKVTVPDSKVAGNTTSGSATGAKRVHRVSKGENPWVIAAKYGVKLDDFFSWNNLTKKSVLQVGDECVVYVN